MKVKKNNADAEFLTIPARAVKQRGRPHEQVEVHHEDKAPLAVSAAKLKDLLKLCTEGVIPRAYHDFYLELKGAKKVDELPEPHIEDDSDYE